MVSTSQPASAIQPTIGMMKMSPWTTILLNHPGSWKGQAKLSPTLVTAGSVAPDRPTREACARAARAAVEQPSAYLCQYALTRAGGLDEEHAENRGKDDQGLDPANSARHRIGPPLDVIAQSLLCAAKVNGSVVGGLRKVVSEFGEAGPAIH